MNKGGNFLQQILKGIIAIVCLIILGIVAYLMMTPEDTASQAQTRQVTDATGQVLTIPVHPQRVVFLNVSNLDLYYAAGGRDTIAGKPTSDSMSPELADAMKDVPAVGIIHSPNMETILSLKPDLVIGVNVPFHNQIRQTLEQNGIPLYINSLDSLEDTGKTLRFFGELTGKEEEADARADEIQKRCDAVVEALPMRRARGALSYSVRRKAIIWLHRTASPVICSSGSTAPILPIWTVPSRGLMCHSAWNMSSKTIPRPFSSYPWDRAQTNCSGSVSP